MSEEANEKSPPGTIRYNFQPLTATLSATIHSVTDGRTDRQRDDSIVPIADYTANYAEGGG